MPPSFFRLILMFQSYSFWFDFCSGELYVNGVSLSVTLFYKFVKLISQRHISICDLVSISFTKFHCAPPKTKGHGILSLLVGWGEWNLFLSKFSCNLLNKVVNVIRKRKNSLRPLFDHFPACYSLIYFSSSGRKRKNRCSLKYVMLHINLRRI